MIILLSLIAVLVITIPALATLCAWLVLEIKRVERLKGREQ